MTNLRKYGNTPYEVVLVHGGPGAPGEMAPVAKKLSKNFGVLEPLQTKDSVDGQVRQLKEQIEKHSQFPIMLIGWSWGAWLSLIMTARYPKLVKKLILVSGGPFEQKYAKKIMATRLSRLSKNEKQKVNDWQNGLNDDNSFEFAKIGKLISKADSYKPINHKNEVIEFQPHIYEKVWNEAEKLRKTGKLLKLAKEVKCPVVAIHGDYDPHPADGVKITLSKTLDDFKFILLKNCGHSPWYEKLAKDKFYGSLMEELSV